MTNPTNEHAEEALKQIMPRFPKRWHKQLNRLGMDSFHGFIGKSGENPIYTIKSGNVVMMARCAWLTSADTLICRLEVIHTSGTAAVKVAA